MSTSIAIGVAVLVIIGVAIVGIAYLVHRAIQDGEI